MITNFTFLGASLAIIMGIGQMIRPQNGSRNFLLASLFFCLGLTHMITFSQRVGFFSEQPFLVSIQIPLLTLLGPLFYLHFMRILNPPFSTTKKHLVHFMPMVFTVLILMPYLSLSSLEKEAIQIEYLAGQLALWKTFPNNLVVVIFLSSLAYILLPLKTIFPLFRQKLLLKNPVILISLGFILCFSLTILCVIFYQFFDIEYLKIGVEVFYTCWIIAIYLVNQKYPSFLSSVSEDISYAKYQRSQLSNIDTDSILERLDGLMAHKKIYLDEELSLPDLARQLSLTTHQLSEILNHNLKCSFKNYLKKFRIDEAKRLLVEEPSRTILTISMDVGFRSASTFNSSFKKEMGISPLEYRKSCHAP